MQDTTIRTSDSPEGDFAVFRQESCPSLFHAAAARMAALREMEMHAHKKAHLTAEMGLI